MSTFLTKIAHNNRVSLGKPRETQTLAEIITSEKRLIESTQRLASERTKSSVALREWAAEPSQGADLADVLGKVASLFDYLSTAENRFAEHNSNFRLHFKAIRTREEHLSILRRTQRDLAGKIDSQDKKVSKMKEENKDLPEAAQRLAELRQEMVGLTNTVLNEETKLGDFKRSEMKEALSLKLGALLELAENSTVIAELGKLLLASISTERTEPGASRPYYSPDKTDSIMQEAHRCIQEVVFSPIPAEGERRFDVDDDRQYQHDQEREQDDFSPPQTHERSGSGGQQQSFYQQQSYGSQVVPQSHGGREQELSQSHYRESAQSRLDSQQPQHYGQSSSNDRRGEEERASAVHEYEQRTSGDNYNDSTSAWRTQGHSSNPASTKTATPLYSTFSTSASANASREEARGNVLAEPLQYSSSPPRDADPHRSSLAYADSNHRDSREAAARLPAHQYSTQTDSRELDDNAVYDTSYSQSRDYPSHAAGNGSNAPAPSRYEPAPILQHSAPSYSTAAPVPTPAVSTPIQRSTSPTPVSPTIPQAPKSYYSERPYVPKEGDGAYHPGISTPATYAPHRTESPQIPPVAFSAPLDSSTNSYYNSPNVPSTSAPRDTTAAPSSPRSRAPLIRGESALGSKHGDLFVAGATPIATPSSGPFQGTGTSGYNSRGGGDDVSVGSGGGRVNAGAFRRPAGGSQPQGYSYNMQDRERDQQQQQQRPGMVGPSQSDLIRDSYLASSANNPASASTTQDQFETPASLQPGPTDSTAPAPSRFEVSPLHINKRAASRNNTVDDSRSAIAPGGGGGSHAHGREGAEGSMVAEEYLPRYDHEEDRYANSRAPEGMNGRGGYASRRD